MNRDLYKDFLKDVHRDVNRDTYGKKRTYTYKDNEQNKIYTL